MDTRPLKGSDDEAGTFTAQLTSSETTTAHVTPVPGEAPGIITAEPGTTKEEVIYYKSKDDAAGTISGLTRDYTNLNGGVGQQHENGEDWETLQSTEYVNNLIDSVMEGFFLEHQTATYVSTSSFTVETNKTAYYTVGRILRINGSILVQVVSSSYSSPNTTVTVLETTVPASITSVELEIGPKGAFRPFLDEDDFASNSATAVASQQSIKAYSDSATQTMIHKTLTSPVLTTPKTDTIAEETADAGVTVDGLLIKDGHVVGWDGWMSAEATWTRTGDHTFTLPGDQTAIYTKGTRIRYKQGGTYEYGTVISSAYTTLTTVTLATNDDYAMAAGAITDNYYSYAANPQGYPSWFNYTPVWSGNDSMTYSSVTLNYSKFSIIGTMLHLKINAVGTVANASTSIRVSLPVATVNKFSVVGGSGVYNVETGSKVESAGTIHVDTTHLGINRYAGQSYNDGGSRYLLIAVFYEI